LEVEIEKDKTLQNDIVRVVMV